MFVILRTPNNYIMNFDTLKIVEMEIKVLGTGCSKCKSLESMTRKVVEELNLNATVEKVEDIQKIMEYGIISTPGLVINGKVVLYGKVPKVDELKSILTKINKL